MAIYVFLASGFSSNSRDELSDGFPLKLFEIQEMDDVAEFILSAGGERLHQRKQLLLGGVLRAGSVVMALPLQFWGHRCPKLIHNVLAAQFD